MGRRVHSCLAAGVRMEGAGACVHLVDTELSQNAVGVLAEGWSHPELRACHLTDRGSRAHYPLASRTRRGTSAAVHGGARWRAGGCEGTGGEKRRSLRRPAAGLKQKLDRLEGPPRWPGA